MDIYELAKPIEERNKKRQEWIDSLKSLGVTEPWKINFMLQELEESYYSWGIENVFPELTSLEKELLEKMFTAKESLSKEYELLDKKVQELQNAQASLKREILKINQNICAIQGHRMLEKVDLLEEADCHGLSTGIYQYRNCLVCGKAIFENNIKSNDVVVKMKRRNIHN